MNISVRRGRNTRAVYGCGQPALPLGFAIRRDPRLYGDEDNDCLLDSPPGTGPTLSPVTTKLRTSYRVREFAGLAGVTVKALHHYDRLDLLKPARTEAGYRIYSPADLPRLEQIVALRFLGIPLKQIRTLLERDALPLRSTFRQQREVLEDKRRLLDRAIQALIEAVTKHGAASGREPGTVRSWTPASLVTA